jgi:hypothetical protein
VKLEGVNGQITIKGTDGQDRVVATKMEWHLHLNDQPFSATVFGEQSVTYILRTSDAWEDFRGRFLRVHLPTLRAIMKRKRQRPLFPATRHRRSR